MRRIIVVATLVLTLALVSSWSASAVVPMPFDPTFGVDGTVITDVAGGDPEDEPFDLLLLPDGKLAMPGKSFQGASDFDFTILQHNPDGSLDTTFDGDGIAITDFHGGRDEALGLARQADGKLVAAGMITDPIAGSTDFGLVRYNTNGSVDTSFGSSGIVTTDFAGGTDLALDVVVQSDGKIVAAGAAAPTATGLDFALVRYNSDGSLDSTFGSGGLVTTDFIGGTDAIVDFELLADGGFLAVGPAAHTYNGNIDFGIARYDSSGSRVPTFGWGGLVMTDFASGNDIAYELLVQPNGDFLAAGLGVNPASGSNDMAIARYHSNGGLDPSFAVFGKPGVSLTDFAGNYDQILELAIQPDGKILGAGHSLIPGRAFDFAFVRYNPDGTLDPTFGWAGRIAIDMFGGSDGLHGLALLPDGKAIVAGDTDNPATGGDDFFLARFLFADPSWIAGVISNLNSGAFAIPSQQQMMIDELNDIETEITAGLTADAIAGLQSLRSRVDGCPSTADGDDWIVDCTAQTQVRGLIDQVIGKLAGP
jgi:uncharacterized delta-60 repeat protein